MHSGGLKIRQLHKICEQYPLSMHGVGMSLGSAEGVSIEHLQELKRLAKIFNPAMISEHLAWSHWNSIYLNDLLPIPFTEEALDVVEKNILVVQDVLGVPIWIENPTSYLKFSSQFIDEPVFLNEISERTGCGILLDVNNLYISSCNQGFSPYSYLENLNLSAVEEIHLAGHTRHRTGTDEVLIDEHSTEISDEVWGLFSRVANLIQKPVPVLVEWDNNLPNFAVLADEIERAKIFSMNS